jgi:hypothetical protein
LNWYLVSVALAAALLAGCTSDGPRSEGGRLLIGGARERVREEDRRADPSKVIAAELAFARLAQEKGQWTAFLETSADDAVMFVPQPVNAHDWLKGRANPPQAVRWQPHQVWSSCDGSLAVTKGAWQRPNGTVGYFTTVWERQRDGDYKWVMDQGDVLAQPLAAPEMVAASVADCAIDASASATAMAGVAADDRRSGWSRDGTLIYSTDVRSDQSRSVRLRRWNGTAYEEVLRSDVAAGG